MASGKAIGSLFVEYRATADKYLADLKQMAKDSKEFERTIVPLKNQLLDIGKGMSVVGGLVTTAFVAMSKQAANYGDAIRDASIRTGVSTEALSGLKFAAEQTGTSFEAINTGLIRMSRNALAAAQGTKQSEKAFNALGVSVKDASGHLRSQDLIMGDVAEAFSKMKDGTEKAALAQQVFGRGGAQMIEFLNQGKAGLKAFQDQAAEMGLVVGRDAANAADQFNDSLNALSNAQLGLSNTIGTALLPALTKMVNFMTGAVVEFRKFTAVHPELIRVTFALGAALTGSGGLILGLAGVLALLPKLSAAFLALTGPVGIAALAIGAFVSAMFAFPKFRGVVLAVIHDLIQALGFLGSYLGSVGKSLLQLATGQFKTAWETMSTSLDRGFRAAADSGNTFDATLKGIKDALNFTVNPLEDTRQGVDDLGGVFDGSADKAKKIKDRIEELTKSFVSTIRPADELSEKLTILLARFDAKDVVRAYASEIIQAADTQRQFGVAVDGTIASLEAQALVMQRAADIIKANRDSILEGIKLPKTPDFLNQAPIVPPIDLSKDLGSLQTITDASHKMSEKIIGDVADISAARDKDREVAEKNAEKIRQALERATQDVKNSAGHIFDDMFVKGQNVFTSLKNLLKGGALSLGRSIFEDIAGALLGPIKLAFDNFFKGLISGPLEGLGKAISKRIAQAVAEGAATSVASGAGSAAAGAAGPSIGQQIGSQAGGAAGSFAGSFGGSALGSAIGSVVGALILKGNAKRTEENTRETRDWLELQTNAWNPLFNQMVYYQKSIWELFSGKGMISGNGRLGPSAAVAGMPQIGVSTINADFNFNPTLNFNVSGGDRSELTIRDEMDQIMTALETGIRGYRERLMQIVRDSFNGPESTPVPTNS